MGQKGFTHLLLAFLILAVAVVILIYPRLSNNSVSSSVTKTPLPTPQNQTYTDKELGLTFTYPKGYSFVEDTEKMYSNRHHDNYRVNFTQTYGYPPPTLIKALVLKGSGEDLDSSPFSIWVFDNSNSVSTQRWYQNYWYYPFVWGEYEPKKSNEGPSEESRISGQIANFKIIDYQPNSPKLIYLYYQKKMYLIRIFQQPKDQSNLGNTILGSLKFQ